MAQGFDAGMLDQLRSTKEVRIHSGKALDKTAIIWVVVADNDVFVRSVTGPKGRWYKAAATDGRATLEVGDRSIPVRVTAATDDASIERASKEFLAKYTPSPYAPMMVRPEVLETTLRLEPL
jgi:hypothetical protein